MKNSLRKNDKREDRRIVLLKNRAAITLIEMVVTMGVMAIGTVSSLFALNFMNGEAAQSRCTAAARVLAQRQIQRIMATPHRPPASPSALMTEGSSQTAVDIYREKEAAATDEAMVQGVLTTNVEEIAAVEDLWRVTVTVNYTYRGRARSVRVQTLRTSDNN